MHLKLGACARHGLSNVLRDGVTVKKSEEYLTNYDSRLKQDNECSPALAAGADVKLIVKPKGSRFAPPN